MSTHESGSECALLRQTPDSAAEKQNLYGSANRITSVDRAIIARYFDGGWSPASAIRSARPVKLRRRWMIGGKLPERLGTDALPRQLESKLSKLDPGYERLLVGGDVLCIELASLGIVDVMHNAGISESRDSAQLLADGRANRTATAAGGPGSSALSICCERNKSI